MGKNSVLNTFWSNYSSDTQMNLKNSLSHKLVTKPNSTELG